MIYKSMQHCVLDLERKGHLLRIENEIDPYLEAAEIHRRVFSLNGPALLFTRLKDCSFPAVSNLFGTEERSAFIFRKSIRGVKALIQCKANPSYPARHPIEALRAAKAAWNALPKRSLNPDVLKNETTVGNLPKIVSWPKDGGAFITLPQVCTEDPDRSGLFHSNLGMYRIQLNGNKYKIGKEIGLHYQIHRGIGVHHQKAAAQKTPLRVSVFVGGPPAHSFAAVMPLPEGLPELFFAGSLAGRGFRYSRWNKHLISADADFCIVGTIDPRKTLPEGPFGDHLGYYSLTHDFPVLNIEKIFHRDNAIWPFTVVGRPPQEDSMFGSLVHKLTKPVVANQIPGLKALHAIDATGVHPLLLAIGNERYTPFLEQLERPQELLTIANAILGFGQCSLAKYLFIANADDNPDLDIHNVKAFLSHMLERIDLRRDLHFQTETTIDTLDYSGTGLNQGSKLILAAVGNAPKRTLGKTTPRPLSPLISSEKQKCLADGILAIECPKFKTYDKEAFFVKGLAESMESNLDLQHFPLLVLVDSLSEVSGNFNNFLWVCFTRSNPSHDIYGVKSFYRNKHWGCELAVIIDGRKKPHHAEELHSDPLVSKRIDQLFNDHPELRQLRV